MSNIKNISKNKISNSISNNEFYNDFPEEEKNCLKIKKSDFEDFKELFSDLKSNLIIINQKFENFEKCKLQFVKNFSLQWRFFTGKL